MQIKTILFCSLVLLLTACGGGGGGGSSEQNSQQNSDPAAQLTDSDFTEISVEGFNAIFPQIIGTILVESELSKQATATFESLGEIGVEIFFSAADVVALADAPGQQRSVDACDLTGPETKPIADDNDIISHLRKEINYSVKLGLVLEKFRTKYN